MGIDPRSAAGKAVLRALGGGGPGRGKPARPPGVGPGWAVTLDLACRLYSTANSRTHWSVQRRRVKEQRAAFDLAVQLAGLTGWRPPFWPVRVTITHQTGGTLMDSDNLGISAKGLRDHVARWLGVGDSPADPVAWDVVQCPGVDGVFVRIEPGR